MILRGQVDLATPPWPDISAPAKDLVTKLLNRDPNARLTAQQVLVEPAATAMVCRALLRHSPGR